MAKEQNADVIKQQKLKALELTLGKIEKDFGKGSIMKLGDSAVEDVLAISSGSIALNMCFTISPVKGMPFVFNSFNSSSRAS